MQDQFTSSNFDFEASMDLPPGLKELLRMGESAAPQGMPPSAGMNMPGPATPMGRPAFKDGGMVGRPSYEQGGVVTPNGPPMPAQAGGAGLNTGAPPMSGQAMEAEVQRIMTEQPEAMAQIQQAIQEAMDSGELTPQELNQVVQLATVAIQDPSTYPQMRAYAIQQGIGTEQDVPQEYDQGLLFALLVAARAMQGGAPAAPAPAAGLKQPPIPGAPTMKDGGKLPEKSPHKSGVIPINAHEGEFVIPKHIVRAKGTEFFEKMLENYSGKDNDAS